MEEFDLPMDSVCVPVRPGHVLMTRRRNFVGHAATCNKLHGRTSVVTDYQLQTHMIREAYKNNESCSCA